MRPVRELPVKARRRVDVVLTDIDDTLTDGGSLPSASLAALEALAAAGLIVVPVTGRPAGWCDHIARMWPVDAVVGENGALYFAYDRKRRHMRKVYAKTKAERAADAARLAKLRQRILSAVPGAAVASDQAYRVADLAIDFCEDVAPLPEADVERIVAIFRDAGAAAKVSSIHVNGWFGAYDKLSMAGRCLDELFGIDIAADNARIVFVGDSPNDAPMFAHFKNAVGVANVTERAMPALPAWVTEARSARGFVELADLLVDARRSADVA